MGVLRHSLVMYNRTINSEFCISYAEFLFCKTEGMNICINRYILDNVVFQIMLDTLYVLTRTFIFVLLVVQDTNNAIGAFSIAQILSATVLSLSYFGFFAWYIPKLKEFNKKEGQNSKLFNDLKDFPFDNVFDFFPGIMKNNVSRIYSEVIGFICT